MGIQKGLRRVWRIGVETLVGNVLSLRNRSGLVGSYQLTPEQTKRWRKVLMPKRRGNSNFTKVTGLFRSKKKKGLYLGSTDEERLGALIDKIKEAKKVGKQVTFFLWKSTYDDGPVFNLTVDLAQDRKEGSRRPIKNDDFDEPDAEEAEATEEPEDDEAEADPFD